MVEEALEPPASMSFAPHFSRKAQLLMPGFVADCACIQCGNHRYGQLGISEKVEKPVLQVCDECRTLQALVECNECPKVCPFSSLLVWQQV